MACLKHRSIVKGQPRLRRGAYGKVRYTAVWVTSIVQLVLGRGAPSASVVYRHIHRCLRHNCFLRESYPQCGKPFQGPFRFLNSAFVGSEKDLQQCAYCNRPVANPAPSERADNKTLRLCHVLGSLVRKSSCEGFLGFWRDSFTLCAVRLPQDRKSVV